MDKIETYRENRITDLIREIVNTEITKRVEELRVQSADMFMTRSDLETFMEMDAYSYITDEVDDAVRQVVRNELTVEVNI